MSASRQRCSPGADYVLLIGERESCRCGRALLRKAFPHVIAHAEDSPSRAVRLLGGMSYGAVLVWWWKALTLEQLEAIGKAAAPAPRQVFTAGAPHELIARIGGLGPGWRASDAVGPAAIIAEMEELLGQPRTRQRGAPLFRRRHNRHIDIRPVTGILARSAGQPLTKGEVVVLATRLARMSFSERQEAIGCKRRFIEKYEQILRSKLEIEETDDWLLSGLDMLAREGRLGETGLGRGEQRDPK